MWLGCDRAGPVIPLVSPNTGHSVPASFSTVSSFERVAHTVFTCGVFTCLVPVLEFIKTLLQNMMAKRVAESEMRQCFLV